MIKVVNTGLGKRRYSSTEEAIALSVLLAALASGVACSSDSEGGVGGTGAASGSGGAGTGGASSQGGSGTGGAISSSGGSGGGSSGVIDPAWLECEQASDCVVIAAEWCCGCDLIPVNAQFEAEATPAPLLPGACADVGCAYEPCPPDPQPACEEGVCGYQVDCDAMFASGQCGNLGQCRNLNARPCIQNWQPSGVATLGCIEIDLGCDDVITCTTDPESGIQYVFGSGCIPAGWTPDACGNYCPIENAP